MNKVIFVSLIILFCFSCCKRQTMSREELILEECIWGNYPMDSLDVLAKGVNPYSVIVDYPLQVDSTKKFDRFRYYTKLNGKTLSEALDILGTPKHSSSEVFQPDIFYENQVYEKILKGIMQKIDFPIALYHYYWKNNPDNTDETIELYLIKDNESLRVIYGENYYESKLLE